MRRWRAAFSGMNSKDEANRKHDERCRTFAIDRGLQTVEVNFQDHALRLEGAVRLRNVTDRRDMDSVFIGFLLNLEFF